MPDKKPLDLVKLSKSMSYALRHAPEKYGLTLGEDGWVRVDDLLAALRHKRPEWGALSPQDFAAVNSTNDKPRFEIVGDNIRAMYGHSAPVELEYTPAVPPEILYHGTQEAALKAILSEGLKSMRRQYVHFSNDEEMARRVAKRKGGKTVILRIKAGEAHRAGIEFYQPNDTVWLTEVLPPQFIEQP